MDDRAATDQGAAAEMSPSAERDDPYQGIIAAVLGRGVSDVVSVADPPGHDAGAGNMLDGEDVDDPPAHEDDILPFSARAVQGHAPNVMGGSTDQGQCSQSAGVRRSARTRSFVDRYTPPPHRPPRRSGRHSSEDGSRHGRSRQRSRSNPRGAEIRVSGPTTRGAAKRERLQSSDEGELKAPKAPRMTPAKLAPPQFRGRTTRKKKRSSNDENIPPAKIAKKSTFEHVGQPNERTLRMRRRRYMSQPLVNISTMEKQEKLRATQVMNELGIKLSAGPYDPKTTHVVVSSLGRNEKTLCGMAAGAWIVGPDFVSSCQKASDITEETTFEVKQAKDTSISDGAPKHWRTRCENLGTKAFAGVKAVFYGTFDGPGTNVLERIVTSGGGCVLRKTAPFTNILEQGVANVAIIGGDRVRGDRTTRAFITAGLPCVSPSYIVDWVAKPLADLTGHCLFGSTPTPDLQRMETERRSIR